MTLHSSAAVGERGLTRVERSLLALVLALTALAGVGRYVGGIPHVVAFILAALALAGLAWTVSFSTEQIGMRFGPAVTGTLQSTVGNLPEFFVVIFALQAQDTTVAQTAIIGSILVNALLVLGMVLIAGARHAPGRHHALQPAPAERHRDAAARLVVHDRAGRRRDHLARSGREPSRRDDLDRRRGRAAGRLRDLDARLPPLRSRRRRRAGAASAGRPGSALRTALTLLIAAGVGSAFVSDWFVNALEPTIHAAAHLAGVRRNRDRRDRGQRVENVAGIYLAFKGKTDLAISVVKNSVAQIAAFLYPLLVLVSLLTASHLTFALAPVWAGALIGTAILIWQITGDGEATLFEGAALIAMYVVLATVAAFEHSRDPSPLLRSRGRAPTVLS